MNNYIDQKFKTKKILHFVADLVTIYDYDSYHDLADSDKAEFAGLLLEASGKTSEAECIVESSNFDQLIIALRTALKSDTKDNNQILLHILKENAVSYYENIMESIFNYVHQDYHAEHQEWMDHASNNADPDEIYGKYLEGLA